MIAMASKMFEFFRFSPAILRPKKLVNAIDINKK